MPLAEQILTQSTRAIAQADVVLFVIDAQVGILPQERSLAATLKRTAKAPILLVANKADSTSIETQSMSNEYHKLGLGEPITISAINGRNTGELMDKIFELLSTRERKPQTVAETPEESPIRLSIIGKPNVGKSSLFNKLIGEDRVIVSSMAHTTREPYDTTLTYSYTEGTETKEQSLIIIDTAGIRRKSKVEGELEHIGVQKSIHAMSQSDIILFVLDGSEPLSTQDKQLGGLIEQRAKSVIIVLNKWDLATDTSDHFRNTVKADLYANFPYLSFAPIVLASASTGYRVHQIFPLIIRAWHARHRTIPVSALEYFLKNIMKKHAPSRGKGTRQPTLMGMRQIGTNPPVFEIFVKYRTSLHRSYLNFIEHKLREQFDFFGTPIIIKLTKMKR